MTKWIIWVVNNKKWAFMLVKLRFISSVFLIVFNLTQSRGGVRLYPRMHHQWEMQSPLYSSWFVTVADWALYFPSKYQETALSSGSGSPPGSFITCTLQGNYNRSMVLILQKFYIRYLIWLGMARPESLYHNYYSSYVEPADTMLRPNNLRSKSSYNINQPTPAANKFGSR